MKALNRAIVDLALAYDQCRNAGSIDDGSDAVAIDCELDVGGNGAGVANGGVVSGAGVAIARLAHRRVARSRVRGEAQRASEQPITSAA